MKHRGLIKAAQESKVDLIRYVNTLDWDRTLLTHVESMVIMFDLIVDELEKIK